MSLRYQYFRASVLGLLDEHQQKEEQTTVGAEAQEYKRGYEDAITDMAQLLPEDVLRAIAEGKCEPKRTEKQGLMLLAGLSDVM